MKSTKTTPDAESTSTSATTQSPASPASAETPPPPDQLGHAPSVPGNWTKLGIGEVRQYKHLTGAQGVQANAVAAELGASATYATDFGPHAPSQGVLVTALKTSGALVLEQPRAAAWDGYVTDMRVIQGDETSTLMDQLGAVIELAKVTNPELAQSYPLTIAFLAARSEATARGVETKKAKAKAKKQQAAPTAAAEPASANTPVVSAEVAPAKPAGS